MFVSSRIVKTLATVFIGAAFVLCTGIVGGEARAQISGTIGGDLVDPQLIEDEGIFFEAGGPMTVPTDENADPVAAATDGTSNTILCGAAQTPWCAASGVSRAPHSRLETPRR